MTQPAADLKMNADTGMYPPHPCRQCGTTLNADGGHPAELYAGTYTGLCYRCQNGAAYSLGTYPSGAAMKSHLFHCPAWRRDREEHIHHPACAAKDCQEGKVRISRADGQGGDYYVQCPECRRRHTEHPAVAPILAAQAAYSKARRAEQVRLSAEWVRACKKAFATADLKDARAAKLAAPFLAALEQWQIDNPYPELEFVPA